MLGPELGSPDPKELSVEDAYIDDSLMVDIETPVVSVLTRMINRQIGAALVTAHGRLAGIFTAMDACEAYHDILQETYHPPPQVA